MMEQAMTSEANTDQQTIYFLAAWSEADPSVLKI